MTFASYLLTIVGISVIGVIIEIIMPDGEMYKFVKGIFALFVTFTIIAPVPKLLNKSETVTAPEYKTNVEYSYDEEYVRFVNELYVDNQVREAERDIKRLTGIDTDVDMVCENKKILEINVKADKQVISENDGHILFTDNVKMYFVTKFNIEAKQVNVVWK